MEWMPDELRGELENVKSSFPEASIEVKSQEEAVITFRSPDKKFLVYITAAAFIHELEPVTYAVTAEAYDTQLNCEASSLRTEIDEAAVSSSHSGVTVVSATCRVVSDWLSRNTPAELSSPAAAAAAAPSKESPKAKKTKNRDERSPSSRGGKLSSMKTAEDVISRVEWDPELPRENFLVGYQDRFLGVIEKPFSVFKWTTDLCDSGTNDSAIPQHRIVYFKYKSATVWNKEDRLDLVFGSTGQERRIHQIIDELGRDPFNFEEYAQDVTREEIVTDIYQVDWAEKSAKNDPDSDYEDSAADAEIPEEKSESKSQRERPNYFFAFRVSSESLAAFTSEFQTKYFAKYPDSQQFNNVTPSHLHVTLGVLRIDRVREFELAIQLMMDALDLDLISPVKLPITVRVRGPIKCWHKRIAIVQLESEQLQRISNRLLLAAEDYGLKTVGNRLPFCPHITLLKFRGKGAATFDEAFLTSDDCPAIPEEELNFSRVLLCSMSEKGEDGFYRIVTEFGT